MELKQREIGYVSYVDKKTISHPIGKPFSHWFPCSLFVFKIVLTVFNEAILIYTLYFYAYTIQKANTNKVCFYREKKQYLSLNLYY